MTKSHGIVDRKREAQGTQRQAPKGTYLYGKRGFTVVAREMFGISFCRNLVPRHRCISLQWIQVVAGLVSCMFSIMSNVCSYVFHCFPSKKQFLLSIISEKTISTILLIIKIFQKQIFIDFSKEEIELSLYVVIVCIICAPCRAPPCRIVSYPSLCASCPTVSTRRTTTTGALSSWGDAHQLKGKRTSHELPPT